MADPTRFRRAMTARWVFPVSTGDQSRVHLAELVRVQTIEADSLGLFASV